MHDSTIMDCYYNNCTIASCTDMYIIVVSLHRSVSAMEIIRDMTVVGVSLVTMDLIALSHKFFPDDHLLHTLIVTGLNSLILLFSHVHLTQDTWLY